MNRSLEVYSIYSIQIQVTNILERERESRLGDILYSKLKFRPENKIFENEHTAVRAMGPKVAHMSPLSTSCALAIATTYQPAATPGERRPANNTGRSTPNDCRGRTRAVHQPHQCESRSTDVLTSIQSASVLEEFHGRTDEFVTAIYVS